MPGKKVHLPERLANGLSICLIVKNEEGFLADCLKSIREFADEIVTVDTGSTDRTVEIAESFGAKVIHSEWRGDFSYSRNISLDHAGCRWILWLDADDRVPAFEIEKIKKLKSAPADRAFFLKVRNVRRGGFGEQWFQLRMFPNRPEIRFERKIHEQILPSLVRLGIPTRQVEVRIDHIGYEKPKMQRDKARRNLEILLADLINHPEDPLYLAAIANSYFVMGEFGKARKWYEKILDISEGQQKHPDLYRQTPTSIGLCLKSLEDLPGAWEWIEKALKDDPRKIDSLFVGAEVKEKMEDPAGAAELYERVLEALPLCSSCPVDPEAMKAKSLLRLGRIYTMAGRWDRGEAAYRKCTATFPAVGQGFRELGELLLATGKWPEAANHFRRAIDLRPGDSKAYIGLAKALVSSGRIQEAAGVLEKMKNLFPRDPPANNKPLALQRG